MKQTRNSIIRGTSGALGEELVFRQRAGKTVMSLPAIPREDNPTNKQVGIRGKFKDANRYAKMVLEDPALKAAYKAKAPLGTSAQNLALADFFKAPEILDIDLSSYTGAIGSTILIEATDDFKVKSVQVSIISGSGEVMETGAAVVNPGSGDFWTYTATTGSDGAAMVKVDVSDLPGNVTTQELSL
jgi:hypothetical protein